MLTAKGQPLPGNKVDIEEDATIVTYGSKSQKTIIVAKYDSVTNDIPDSANPNAPKFPNSELTFQLLQQQAGDAVSDTRLFIHHAIEQPGTLAVLKDAHQSKDLALTDHPTAMKCKVVTTVYTWAQIPGDITGHGAMAMEIGAVDSC